MKKKVLLGILALTLIFGLAVIGCDDSDGDGGTEKKLIIENIGISGNISVVLMDEWGSGGNAVAGGTATSVVQGSNVTITLKKIEGLGISSTNWTGKGNYVVYLFETLDLYPSIVPNYGAPDSPNFKNFDNQITTVNWSEFQANP